MKKKSKKLFYVVWTTIALFILIGLFVQLPFVQKYIINTIANTITKEYKWQVKIQKVQLALPLGLNLSNVSILDNNQDTLLNAHDIQISFTPWLKEWKKPQITSLYFNHLALFITKKNNLWNFQTPSALPTSPSSNQQKIYTTLQNIQFQNLQIHIQDSLNHINFNAANIVSHINLQNPTPILNDLSINHFGLHIIHPPSLSPTPHDSFTIYTFKNSVQNNIAQIIHLALKAPIHLPKTNLSLSQGAFSYNHHFQISNLSLLINNMIKDSQKITYNAQIKASLQQKNIKISNNLSATQKNIKITKLSLQTPQNDLNIEALLQFKDNHNTALANAQLKIKNNKINVDELASLINQKTNFDNKTFFLDANVKYANDQLQINDFMLKENLSNFLQIKNARFIDSLKTNLFYLKELAFYIDSSQIPFIKKHISDSTSRLYSLIQKTEYVAIFADAYFIKNQLSLKGAFSSNFGNVNHETTITFQQQNLTSQIKYQLYHLDLSQFNPNFQNITANGLLNMAFTNKHLSTLQSSIHIDSLKCFDKNLSKINIKSDYQNDTLNNLLMIVDSHLHCVGSINLFLRDSTNLVAQTAINFQKIQTPWFTNKNLYATLGGTSLWNKRDNKILNTFRFVNVGYLSSPTQLNPLQDFIFQYNIINNNHDLSLNFQKLGYIHILGLQNIQHLSQYLQNKEYYYFTPSNLLIPSHNTSPNINPKLTININLSKITAYKNLFNFNIQELDNVIATLSFNNTQKNLVASLSLSSFKTNTFAINNLKININTSPNNAFAQTSCDSLSFIQKIVYHHFKTTFSKTDNQATFSLQSDSSTNFINLIANIQQQNHNSSITFQKSLFQINQQKWHLHAQAQLDFTPQQTHISNLLFFNQNQFIEFKLNDFFNNKEFFIRGTNIHIQPFLHIFDPTLKTQGNLDFNIYFNQQPSTTTTPNDLLINATINNTHFNQDSIGQVFFNYASTSTQNTFNLYTQNPRFQLYVNKQNNPQIPITIQIKNIDLKFLYPYLKDVFYSVQGRASGTLNLSTLNNQYFLDGTLHADSAYLGVLATQCLYHIQQPQITILKNKITFQNIGFNDLNKNTGVANGFVNLDFNDFSRFQYHFDISANNIQAYNTSIIDNDFYYGTIYGDITLQTTGNMSGDSLFITLHPNPTSQFVYNAGSNKQDVYQQDIYFKKDNKKPLPTSSLVPPQPKIIPNFLMNINISPLNDAQTPINFSLLLNKLNDDIIVMKAIPNLNIFYDEKKGFQLNGDVAIVDGKYDFTIALSDFKVKKSFIIDNTTKNSLNWSGDPLLGELNINAKYIASKVNVEDLGVNINGIATRTNTPASQNTTVPLSDIDVIALLKGSINNFSINFDINFASSSLLASNPNFNNYISYLQNLKNNKAELNRQATYLILFNAFTMVNTLSATPIASNLTTNVYNSISNLVANYFNALSNKFINFSKFSLELNSNVYNSTETSSSSTTASNLQNLRGLVGLSGKYIISPKLLFTSDVNLDFSWSGLTSTTTTQNTNARVWNPVPNANLEYKIIKQKGLDFNLNLFYKSFYDNWNRSTRGRAGTSISINKDFDIQPKK